MHGSIVRWVRRSRNPVLMRGPRWWVSLRSTHSTSRSADDDFADLHDRRYVRVVLDVAHDLLGVRSEGGLVRLDRVAEDVAHADIGRRCAGSAAAEALVDRV